jgi:hypothetical protein
MVGALVQLLWFAEADMQVNRAARKGLRELLRCILPVRGALQARSTWRWA